DYYCSSYEASDTWVF
nr:immunoglobulin light chain junction region [Macaca mulatta]MOW06893.1 immunoglobulin light chain junction region [Macaca mulatta]MOW07010.1 immunoglobulin light chain junction region [Macaca mulatta]